ncbi:xanthine dehydrogenase family protein molybdopterin-binding subunit [Roseobacter weihaiensis]|uniref:xanthine dehydrogenase family protein molybdopterin-binding subunit n=1 Tax=Roseobacter weihaiensis TaxID=2763262 RepID=UPI001D0A480E|nr:molybdopterin cofactor-binding domain-containing protein [Roseobacter sp. H9]
MSRVGKIARRGFLVGSAAIAGGVAFGVYKLVQTPENPLREGLRPSEASFNPWVKISADRITLITPHVDVGQGVVHMQALLLAEELDLEPGQFETAFGPPAPAYYNTAMAAEGVPFATTDRGMLAETSRDALGALSKVIGLQGTGGSSSVPDSFVKLRVAGAVARETLKRAAALAYGVEPADLRTQAGSVILADGTAVPYQALAEEAALLEPDQDVALRDPADWKLIGQPTLRQDVVAKSTGMQSYGIDIRLDGMLFAAIRLSPYRGAVGDADLSLAQDMPGVVSALRISKGFAVVADNTWTAMQAALALEPAWGPAPYPAEQAAHWEALAASFTDARWDATWRDDGDVEAALSAEVIAAEYRAPYVAHQPLEPLNATVRVTEDRVEVWTSTQLPPFVQRAVARITNHRKDQVVLRNQYAGGSFGHRLEMDHVLHAAEIAVQMKGTPIKLTYSREEDFAQDYPRHMGMSRARGAVAGGKVQALALDIAAPAPIASQLDRLGYPFLGPDIQIAAGAWNAPYAIDNFRVRAFRTPGLAPTSSWRAVGASSCGFFLEGFLDELIHAAGADPMEERLRLCRWDAARGTLEAVAEMSNWGSPLASGKGRGVALVESFGVPTAEVVEVSATPQGIRIDKVWVAADVGRVIDPVNFENQVQGGVIWGLGHAINSEITYAEGQAEQSNYHDAEGLRFDQSPEIFVRGLETHFTVKGVGEPPVPPAAPALANAIFDATGQRLREMPFYKHIDFA